MEGREGGDVVKEMEAMDLGVDTKAAKILDLLRRFLGVQQRRAEAYARWHRGFTEYMAHGGDLAYQQLCADITSEFSDCSKQVIEIESLFLAPEISRSDLACLLRDVQAEEKQKLHLTARIQLLKKAGRPSERQASHELFSFSNKAERETEDAETDAEHESSLKEAIRGVQDAVTNINDHLEAVWYEIEALQPV